MNEKKTNASIHAETPDGQNFTVQIEGTGGGDHGLFGQHDPFLG